MIHSRAKSRLRGPRWLVVLALTQLLLPGANEATAEPAQESEFCEVLHRFNAEKKIPEAGTRDRVSGEYGEATDTDRLRTWNVETICGEFLVAVPLWADVSPPILTPTGEGQFEDSMGGTWDFQLGDDNRAESVTFKDQSGKETKMIRLGSPRSFE